MGSRTVELRGAHAVVAGLGEAEHSSWGRDQWALCDGAVARTSGRFLEKLLFVPCEEGCTFRYDVFQRLNKMK